jgi:2-methylisocitrate lyase-like PEP mutase family enzyme
VGCNLEDTDHAGGGLTPVAKQASYLADVRAAAGADLVINARVDVFVRGGDLADGVERANAYLAAGADCVYPILVRSPELLRSFVAEVDGPVNALRLPELPDPASAGVARISLGPGLWRRTQAMLREALLELA